MEFQKQIEVMLATCDPRTLNFEDELQTAFRDLALRGWTITMRLTAGDVFEIAATSPSETDAFFVDYYTIRCRASES